MKTNSPLPPGVPTVTRSYPQPWMALEPGTTSDDRAMTSHGVIDHGVDLARTESQVAAAVPLGS